MAEIEIQQFLERRLRIARSKVFSDSEAEAKAAEEEIKVCKKLLAPHWQARADNSKHNREQKFLYSTD